MLILLSIFLTLALPLMLGYLFTAIFPIPPFPASSSPAESVAWRLLLGLAALILLATYPGAFLSVHQYAWFLVIPLLAAFLLLPPARRQFLADFRPLSTKPLPWLIALTAAAILYLFLYPILGPHRYINFGGTLNNDNFIYVTNIQYILHHPFLQTAQWTPDHPLYRLTPQFTGWQVAAGRLGAESFAALVATLTHLDPLQIYQPFFAAIYLFWLAAGYLLLKHLSGAIGFASSLPAHICYFLFAALQPLFLFFFANGNFANLLGICLAVALIIRLRLWLNQPQKSHLPLIHTAVLLAALVATYPELLPSTLALAALSVLEPLLHLQWPRLKSNLYRAVSALLLALLLNPINTIRGLRGMLYLMHLSLTATSMPPNIMGPLHPSQYLPTLFGMFAWNLVHLPHLLAWPLSLALLLTLLLGLRRSPHRLFPLSFLLLFLLQIAATCFSAYTYGYQKAIQYWSLYLVALLFLGILSALETLSHFLPPLFPKHLPTLPSSTPHSALFSHRSLLTPQSSAFLLSALFSLAWLAYLLPAQLADMYAKSSYRHITRAMFTLPQHIPPQQPILLRTESFPSQAYYACFLPYILRDHPLYFPQVDTSGGSLNLPEDPLTPPPPLTSPCILYGPKNHDTILLLNPHPLLADPEFTLDQPTAYAHLYAGAWPDEPRFGRWMNETLGMEIYTFAPIYLNIKIASRFSPLPSAPNIALTLDNQKSLIPLAHDQAAFSIPLPPGPHLLQLHSLIGAKSPNDFHLSNDGRRLSYNLTTLSLTNRPLFPPPTR